jgi:phage gp36-like protein
VAAYATVAQATDLYGLAYLTIVCDRNGDGTLDSTSFEKNLEVATRQMNAYLLGRYSLPLLTPPEHFQKLCTDIAVYNAAPSADVRTVEMKDRYVEAIKFMELCATGKVKLEVTADATAVNASLSSTVETKSTISVVSEDRQFRRDDLKGLL